MSWSHSICEPQGHSSVCPLSHAQLFLPQNTTVQYGWIQRSFQPQGHAVPNQASHTNPGAEPTITNTGPSFPHGGLSFEAFNIHLCWWIMVNVTTNQQNRFPSLQILETKSWGFWPFLPRKPLALYENCAYRGEALFTPPREKHQNNRSPHLLYLLY